MKKLKFNKETISSLSKEQLANAKGGSAWITRACTQHKDCKTNHCGKKEPEENYY